MARYVISDIHGCAQTFRLLLWDQLKLQKTDELFLLGDYIDRGPDSKGVLDQIMDLRHDGYRVYCLKGNHEDMLLNSMHDPAYLELFLYNGGKATLESFGGLLYPDDIPNTYLDFLEGLPTYIALDSAYLVHAGFNFNNPDPLSEPHDHMWIRNWYDQVDKEWLGDRKIIHGHTPVVREVIETAVDTRAPFIDIDNGCFLKNMPGRGYLCALEMNHYQLYFQPNSDLT